MMMSRSLSAYGPQMKGLWWEIHNLSGKIDATMGRDMCEFDNYNINKRFFSSLIDMNTAPDNNHGRYFSTKTFVLPKELDAINYEIAVHSQVRYRESTTMVNTGPTTLYVGQYVSLVPPLSRKDVYCATACETGDEYNFPLTVPVDRYNTELNILLKDLALLEHQKSMNIPATDLKQNAEIIATMLTENKIFCEMDTTGFISKGEALLHLVGMFADSYRIANTASEFQKNSMLDDIALVSSTENSLEEIIKAVERIYRNPLCVWMNRVNLVPRGRVDESYESVNTEVGLLPVAPGGMCKITVF